MDAKNVSTGKPKISGAVFRAPFGTELPTDTATPLNEAFKELGYVSEDGLTNTLGMTVEDIKAWGGDVVYSDETELSDEWKYTYIESLNPEVLKAVYGDERVTGTLSTGMKASVGTGGRDYASYVFDMILGEGIAKRVVIPAGKVTNIGDTVYKGGTPIGYEVTIKAKPDAAGMTHYDYTKSGD